MRGGRFSIGSAVALAIFTVALLMNDTRAAAQAETVLYSFSGTDGETPYAGVIFGSKGRLYGTTAYGGTYNSGTAFELAPKAGGGWEAKVLHNFGHGKDGSSPIGGMVFDTAGNLYGTTEYGGTGSCTVAGLPGCGTVFELSRQSDGAWTEKVLYDFPGETGRCPHAGLIFGASGSLYGTTYGSVCGGAVAFELSPTTGGGWAEKVLYSVPNTGPAASLVFDGAGNLYGTTIDGGAYDYGTVFELRPQVGGGWAERVLHNFSHSGRDGENPYAGLIFDAAGNLYGTTVGGGKDTICGGAGCGTVFELKPNAGGGWTEEVLHSFNNNGTDGYYPYSSLVFDAAGNLYGTTWQGGANNGGTLFELTPAAGGGWTETVVHDFQNNGTDGYAPYAGLIFDAAGNLYGTTQSGGPYGFGTVFEIKP